MMRVRWISVCVFLAMVSSLAAAQVRPQRIRVSEGVSQGLLIKKVNPDYPPEAKGRKIEGEVAIKINVDRDGNVAKAEVMTGHPLLAPAALEAVKQWKYKPFQLNGEAIEMETTVRVVFVLPK